MSDNRFRSGFVTVVGRPNVGKSTLLNRLVGQKVAIMSDKPQTTRNKITAVLTLDEAQVVFIDTPGIHKPKHKLGSFMVDVAMNALEEVDLILFLLEADQKVGPGDEYIMERLKNIKTPVFAIINKIDLVEKETLLPLIAQISGHDNITEIIPVSALTGENLEKLTSLIVERLPEGPRYYPPDMVTDQPERNVVAELIREKVLHLTREEIPHAVAVVVEDMVERDGGMVFINAVIYTERDSQKGIILGKGGQMLKQIGQTARGEIENLLGSRVYLDLWVKVKKDWRNKEAQLKNFGFTLE